MREMNGKLITVKLGCEIKSGKDTDDVIIRNRNTKNSVNLINADLHLPGLYGVACIDIKEV